jgi:toxin ParE1/3/4
VTKRSSGFAGASRNAGHVSKFTLSPEAIDDLELIWAYIARDNGQAADDVIEAAYRLCGVLGDHPELGRVLEFSQTALSGLRSFVVTDFPNYVIFYRVKGKAVEIVRVLHGARDIERLFDGS